MNTAVLLRPLIKSLALKPQGWEFTNARWLHYMQSRRSRLVTLTQEAQELKKFRLLNYWINRCAVLMLSILELHFANEKC